MDKHQESAASAARSAPAYQATAPHLPGASTVDPPPSYTEALSHPIVESGSQPSVNPSAPPLEANATNPYPHNPYNAQGQTAQQYPPYPNVQADGQFSAWDDRATRILMMQRLEMEERFRQARSQQEQDMLWNLILTDLYMSGYHDFLLVDLIRFWEFQFHIYKSIIDGLSSGSHTDSNWQYFEPMDNVFKGSTDVLSPTTTIGSSILDHDQSIVPHIPVQPLGLPVTTSTVQPVTISTVQPVTTSTVQPITEGSPTVADATAAATIGGGDNSTLPTLPIAQTNETINENIPLLIPNDGVGDGAAAAVAAVTSPADNAANGLMDLGSIQAALPSESTGTSILNDVTSAPVITTQPDSLTKILTGDGDVVRTQPLSMGLPSTTQPLAPIDDSNDGCCGGDGCCDDDGCCGGDGCCDDDGCCGGDGDGCCDDGCDGCDDCDCDGCGDC